MSESYRDNPRLKHEKKIEPIEKDEARKNRVGEKNEAWKVRSG